MLLKLLRSPAFLGTAQLLAAIASTDAELRTPVGLLKVGQAHTRAQPRYHQPALQA